jgi:hypothetical protein
MKKTLVLILCNQYCQNIIDFEKALLQNNIDYIVVCDSCTLDQDKNLLANGFYNLTRSPYIKKPSAWDKSFNIISKKFLEYEYKYFFFIEDDVYSKKHNYIIKFILESTKLDSDLITHNIKSINHSPNWKHWKEEYIKLLKNPHQSFNPICRLSTKLVKKILEYQNTYKKFDFHEILIASLCLENNLTYTNYLEHDILKTLIGHIRYNPILIEKNIFDDKIYHPVKLDVNARKLKFPIDNADTL